jgi:glycosyltransferase involved in cell wall biosynthesis
MKILFVTNIPAPYRMKFFEGLGQHIDITVLYEARNARNIRFSYEGVHVTTYKEIYLSDGYIKENLPNPKIVSHLIKNKYDLIFLTNYRYATEMLAYILVKFLKTPYCIEIDGGRIKKENKLAYYLKKWLLNGAAAYFSPAKAVDEFFIHYGVDQSKLIRYPFTSIDEEYIIKEDELIKKIKRRKDNPLTFLYVGRIIPEKGVDLLVHAYNEYCRISDDNSKLIIVGNSPNKPFLQYIMDHKNKTTEIKDFLSSMDLIKIYDESDVLIFPSYYDPWGLVINEAMARGLVILTSNTVVSANELIEDGINGYRFEINDGVILSIVGKMLKCREIINTASLENIKTISNYTIENMIKTHINYLENSFKLFLISK